MILDHEVRYRCEETNVHNKYFSPHTLRSLLLRGSCKVMSEDILRGGLDFMESVFSVLYNPKYRGPHFNAYVFLLLHIL